MSSSVERRSLVLRGVLDLCLLASLQDRPVYGYELSQRMGRSGLQMSAGSTYPLLARLEKAGAVSTQVRPSDSGPPRKYYSLTERGRELLNEGRVEWSSISQAVSSVLGPLVPASTLETSDAN